MGHIPIGFHFKLGPTILRTPFNRTTIVCRAGTLNFYSVKIALRGVSPMIWRRLRLSGETSLAEFHHIIQIAMGWDDEYLHQFHIYGKNFGISYVGGFMFSDDASMVRLDDFDFDAGDRFTYTYNFYANCVHDIRIEAIELLESASRLPHCVSGNGLASPPRYTEFDLIARFADLLRDSDHANNIKGFVELAADYRVLRFQRKDTNQHLLDVASRQA